MLPLIKDGDILTFEPVSLRKPVFGDVVAFIRPDYDSLAVHRIIGKKAHGLMIRGDFNFDNDGIVPPEKIFGILKCMERGGKSIKFGLGIEKKLIAVLVKTGFFPLVIKNLLKIIKPQIR